MDRKKPVLILGTAVVIALIVTAVVYHWLQEKSYAIQNLETQPVAVAKMDLPWATVLKKDMVTTVPYLKKSLVAGQFPDPAVLEGRTLIYPVKSGEPFFESKLSPAGLKGGGVAAIIGADRRAMAVKVDKIVGVAGFIHPGNRVDVLVTLQRTGPNDTPMTKIVLENVLVLAVGPEIEVSSRQEKPAPVDVITLEVTPHEGEKLALAATEGKLQLALRNFSDARPAATKGTTIPTLLGTPEVKPERKIIVNREQKAAYKPPAQPKPVISIEVIKGNKTSEMNFNQGERS